MLHQFEASCGRISLTLQLVTLGKDIQLVLTGGEAHIGAVALALASGELGHCTEIPGHREGDLTREMAVAVARSLGVTTCVCAGIHYPAISSAEIATVFDLVQKLTDDCLTFVRQHACC